MIDNRENLKYPCYSLVCDGLNVMEVEIASNFHNRARAELVLTRNINRALKFQSTHEASDACSFFNRYSDKEIYVKRLENEDQE